MYAKAYCKYQQIEPQKPLKREKFRLILIFCLLFKNLLIFSKIVGICQIILYISTDWSFNDFQN